MANGVDTQFAFNTRLELTRIDSTKDAKVLQAVAYAYRPDGNRSRVVYEHLGVSADFSYDAVDRLTGEIWSGNVAGSFNYVNSLTTDIGNESTEFSSEACATPQARPDVAPHYQFYAYDGTGNRTLLRGSLSIFGLTGPLVFGRLLKNPAVTWDVSHDVNHFHEICLGGRE